MTDQNVAAASRETSVPVRQPPVMSGAGRLAAMFLVDTVRREGGAEIRGLGVTLVPEDISEPRHSSKDDSKGH
jgi:hypothetical protein